MLAFLGWSGGAEAGFLVADFVVSEEIIVFVIPVVVVTAYLTSIGVIFGSVVVIIVVHNSLVLMVNVRMIL